MKKLSQVDDAGDSIFRSNHAFYRDAMKTGPQLDALTLRFLQHLQDVFDKFERQQPSSGISLFEWSRTSLGIASTNAMMSPVLLRDNPDFLQSVFLVDMGFFYFVNRVPRMFARKYYQARDRVLAALTKYFADGCAVQESAPLIRDREAQLREKGIKIEDIAAYSFSAYIVSLPFPLFNP